MANVYSCTCPTGACYVDGKCHYQHGCFYQARTNADKIRCMSDEELYKFLRSLVYNGPWDKEFEEVFCDTCEPVESEKNLFGREVKYFECEFIDGKCPHFNGDALKWWLGKVIYDGTD